MRILLLLLVLLVVSLQAWLDRATTTRWQQPLWIGIVPINGDASRAARDYIASLDAGYFSDIERFFAREAHRYGIPVEQPVRVRKLAERLDQPPLPAPGAGALATAFWSLRLRWYASRTLQGSSSPPPQIRVYVLYHDPSRSPAVPHSLGLRKGLIGVVHAFAVADMRGSNAIVIAHEIMHTLGATDKYDPATNLPLVPIGLGERDRVPLYPQPSAEIMAGRSALSPTHAQMPTTLDSAVVGPETALEIRWIRR
ncbi:MAG TPA: hypothetical protein VF315_03445 [Steroidobacteraceae bacterium]